MRQPTKKRVLIVDDAVVVRKTLSDAMGQDAALEVAGTACNGRFALAKFPAPKPDIVLLDIEMPEMDGLETVRRCARSTLMFRSSCSTRSPSVAPPPPWRLSRSELRTTSPNPAIGTWRRRSRQFLGSSFREFMRSAICQKLTLSRSGCHPAADWKPRLLTPVHVVAIGVSTGGPDALARLLPTLPADLPVPIVIAQHMPPIFTSLLATRLSAKSGLPVRECVSGEPLRPGCAVIAPGDFHMVVSQQDGLLVLKTNQGAKENYCRPSVDVLFHSIASTFGARALAVVLTGMGRDGLRGCERLRD